MESKRIFALQAYETSSQRVPEPQKLRAIESTRESAREKFYLDKQQSPLEDEVAAVVPSVLGEIIKPAHRDRSSSSTASINPFLSRLQRCPEFWIRLPGLEEARDTRIR
jgi:hypothetical protein